MAQAAASAFAALALSFSSLQTSVVHKQQAYRQARAATSAAELAKADKDARDLDKFAWDIRNLLRDVRHRCRLHHPQPGEPDNDPFLRNDVDKLDYYLLNYARMAAELDRFVTSLASQAVKDPSLVEAAQRLSGDAADLKDQAHALALEARDGNWDLRSADFPVQAIEVERYGLSGYNSSADALDQAKELLSRVR